MAGGGAQINTLPPGPSQGPSAHQRPHSHTPAGAPGQGARWQPKLGAGRDPLPGLSRGASSPAARLSNPAGRVPSRRGRCVRGHRARFGAQGKSIWGLHSTYRACLGEASKWRKEIGERAKNTAKKGPVAPKPLAGQHTHPALPCPSSAQSALTLLLNSISDSFPG